MGAPITRLLGLGLFSSFSSVLLFQSLQTVKVTWLDLGWNGKRSGSSVPWYAVKEWSNARRRRYTVRMGGGSGRGQTVRARVGWIRDQSWKKIRWCVLPRYQRRRACLNQSAWHRTWILQLPRQKAETVAANDKRYSTCTSSPVSPGASCKPPKERCQGLQLSLVRSSV